MGEWAKSEKSAEAYRTISEVAEELKLPQHVLRFWETRFPQVKPLKRAGGRRFYRPEDLALLRTIKTLLYGQGYTIKGVQRMLREQGPRAVVGACAPAPDDSALLLDPLRQDRDDGSPSRDIHSDGGSMDPRHSAALDSPPGLSGAAADTPSPARSEAGATLDLIQAVAADLSECRRLIAAVRSGRN